MGPYCRLIRTFSCTGPTTHQPKYPISRNLTTGRISLQRVKNFFPDILIYFPVPPETHNLTIYLVSWTGLHILLLQNRDDLSEQIRILFANNVLCGDYCTVEPFDNPFVNLTVAALCVDNQTHNQNILRRPGVQYRTQCNQISVTTQQHKTKIVGSRSDSSWIEISFDQHQVIAADAGCERKQVLSTLCHLMRGFPELDVFGKVFIRYKILRQWQLPLPLS